jgi:hypothetical protein
VSGPDILSVGVLPLITQAEAIVTQIACAEPLAGETRLAVGLRALGDELAALAPRALAASEELQAAHRRAANHTAECAEVVEAVRAWQVEVRRLLQAARRSTPDLAVEVDVLLLLLKPRARHMRPTQVWLATVAPIITPRASAFAGVADGVLTNELERAEALAAQLAAAMCEVEASVHQRGVRSAETEALRLTLRETIRRTRQAWQTAQRRLPDLPDLDFTTAAAAAARRDDPARESTDTAREGTDTARESTGTAREGTVTARESTDTAREGTDTARESTDTAREGVVNPC